MELAPATERGRTALLAQAISAAGAVRVCVHGSSMWPAIRRGDVVEIRKSDITQVRVGQVVAYARDGRLIVHRVVRGVTTQGAQAGLITRGDTLPALDPPVAAEDLLGVVRRLWRGKRLIDLDSPGRRFLGRITGFCAPAARVWFPVAVALKRVLFGRRVQPAGQNVITLGRVGSLS